MTNVMYGDEIYNPDIKNEFLNEYEGATRETVLRIFKISYKMENDLQKDLFDFNREQIRKLGFLFTPSTKNSSAQNIRYIEKYINWAIEENLVIGVNPLLGIDREWREQFVANVKILWRKDEIDQIILSRKNGQDQAIVSLLWNGIKGEDNVEIVKLKREDVDKEKCLLTVYDEKGDSRTVVVDQQCIDACLKAYSESDYMNKNGEVSKEAKNKITELVSSEDGYIIRPSKTQVKHFEEAEKNIVYRRISSIAKEIEEPLFNPKNIVNSGMLYLAYRVYTEKGRLDSTDIKLICDKFGMLKDGADGDPEFSRLLLSTLNVETIKKVYSI